MTDSFEPLLLLLWKDLRDERILWQVATIVASVVVAGWLSYLLRPRLRAGDGSRLEFGLGGLRRLVFPLAAVALVLSGRWVLAHYQTSLSLLSIAVSLLTAMAIIRFVVHLQRLVFARGNLLDTFERTIVWLVWIGFALNWSRLASRMTGRPSIRPCSWVVPRYSFLSTASAFAPLTMSLLVLAKNA